MVHGIALGSWAPHMPPVASSMETRVSLVATSRRLRPLIPAFLAWCCGCLGPNLPHGEGEPVRLIASIVAPKKVWPLDSASGVPHRGRRERVQGGGPYQMKVAVARNGSWAVGRSLRIDDLGMDTTA